MEEMRNGYNILTENRKETGRFGEQGIDGRKLHVKKLDVRVWAAFNWLRIGYSGGLL
jgi:hypothetical protein